MLTILCPFLFLSVVSVLSHVPDLGPHHLLSPFLPFVFSLPYPPRSSPLSFSPSFLEFASYPDYPSSALLPPFRSSIFVRPPQILHFFSIFPTFPTFQIHLIHPTPTPPIELISLESALSGSLRFAVNGESLSFFFFYQEQIKEEEYFSSQLDVGARTSPTPNSMLTHSTFFDRSGSRY